MLWDDWPDGLLALRADGTVVAANAAAARLLSTTPSRLVGHLLPGVGAPVGPGRYNGLVRTHHGVEISFAVTLAPIAGNDTLLAGSVTLSGADADEAGLGPLFDAYPSGLAVVSDDGAIVWVNDALCAVTGFDSARLIGAQATVLLHPEDARHLAGFYRAAAGSPIECRVLHRTGSTRWVELVVTPLARRSGTGQFLVRMEDVSARRRDEAALVNGALLDAETGLVNRALLADRLAQALDRAERTGKATAVVVLSVEGEDRSLDGTSPATLVQFARRLDALVRRGDTAARGGDDELTVVLVDLEPGDDAKEVAERLLHKVMPDTDPALPLSVGMSVSRPGIDAPTLMREARLAARRARHTGGLRIVMYTPSVAVIAPNVSARTGATLAEQGLELRFQPIVGLTDGRLLAVDVFVLEETSGAVLTPFELAPRDPGLHVPLGRRLLAEACARVAGWDESGVMVPAVAVEVTTREVAEPGFPSGVLAILGEAGLRPERLVIQLTEAALLDDGARLATTLRRAGVGMAVRGFGTGYGSLSHLQSVGVTMAKVSGTFVAGGVGEQALVASIAGLATHLGVACVADRLSSPGLVERARSVGVAYGQGDAVAAPLAAGEVPDVVASLAQRFAS
ncbi:MAG: EAL domain-containing protein, partial [Acidimicrobiales bacterium]